MTLLTLGCGTSDGRIANVERAMTRSEQTLARANKSYDWSKQDILRMRLAVNDVVERGRLAAQQLELAARDYEYAAVFHHVASVEFASAARNYDTAVGEYEMIASLIIHAASSRNFLRKLCGRSADAEGFGGLLGAYGGNLEQDSRMGVLEGEPLNLPLPVLKSLAERAARMLLCTK